MVVVKHINNSSSSSKSSLWSVAAAAVVVLVSTSHIDLPTCLPAYTLGNQPTR